MLDQRIIELYDEYTHRPLSRKEFLKQLTQLAGGAAMAMSILPLLESDYSTAALTGAKRLFTEYITYPGVNGTTMRAYVARPKARKRYHAVCVIHENRGLTVHIEDVARRAAQAGYLAIAPDALAPLRGDKVMSEDDARQLFTQLKAEENLQNFIRVFDYLETRKDYKGKAGCVGFCWGGAMANNLAVQVPALKAAVGFYGMQARPEDVPKIKAAIQLHYAEMDDRVNAGKDAYEAALKAAGVTYESYLYEGVNHAFHNDTSTARYNEAAAKLAWSRTLAFFEKYLIGKGSL
ncbi:MAG: dienelactone hydrolase family protein [Saprospiraceae bacterium]|nr:dienelactone hydrolase family protein [Saprospiraceae bacterium]